MGWLGALVTLTMWGIAFAVVNSAPWWLTVILTVGAIPVGVLTYWVSGGDFNEPTRQYRPPGF